MRVLSLFSGIGAFEKALTNLGIDYKLVNFCEIDKYASKSYSAIHGVSENLNLHDVCEVDGAEIEQPIDLLTYGFPCTDISQAGLQKGLTDENGNKTRSGLLFDALRIIERVKPKVAIAENVKALVSKKFKADFEWLLGELDRMGYNNYWKVLNATDYGIPQNRERVFIVSIRKECDSLWGFKFPDIEELTTCMRDFLDDEVPQRYYLTSDRAKQLIDELVVGGKIQDLLDNTPIDARVGGESDNCGEHIESRRERCVNSEKRSKRNLTEKGDCK